jgi:hypothetical protein
MAVSLKRGTDSFPVSINDIHAAALTQGGNEVHLYPGTYTANTGLVATDFAFVGIGDKDEIIINGDMTIANTSTGGITFKNISFVGATAGSEGGGVCVTKLGAAACELTFFDCKFSNSEHAVSHNGELSFVTSGKNVTMWQCDARGVDQAIVSNANVEINFSALNTSANAYMQPGTGGGDPLLTATVRASTAGAANSGNMTETVLALIS